MKNLPQWQQDMAKMEAGECRRTLLMLVLAFAVISFLTIGAKVAFYKQRNQASQTNLSATTEIPKQQVEGLKLLVGANPSVNHERTFLPPADSVVITNEAQLSLLIEQTRPRLTQKTNSLQ